MKAEREIVGRTEIPSGNGALEARVREALVHDVRQRGPQTRPHAPQPRDLPYGEKPTGDR